MLLIGTAISLVTAVVATRAMLGLLAGFRWFNNPRFMGAQGQQIANWLQIDYIGKRNIWFAISGVVIALAIGSLGVQGLNLGIDFKGGTRSTSTTPQPMPVDDVRARRREIGQTRTRSSRAAAPSGDGELQELPDPDEDAGPRAEQDSCRRRSRTRLRRALTSAFRTSPRASASRSLAQRDHRDRLLALPDRRSTSRSGSTGSSRCRSSRRSLTTC